MLYHLYISTSISEAKFLIKVNHEDDMSHISILHMLYQDLYVTGYFFHISNRSPSLGRRQELRPTPAWPSASTACAPSSVARPGGRSWVFFFGPSWGDFFRKAHGFFKKLAKLTHVFNLKLEDEMVFFFRIWHNPIWESRGPFAAVLSLPVATTWRFKIYDWKDGYRSPQWAWTSWGNPWNDLAMTLTRKADAKHWRNFLLDVIAGVSMTDWIWSCCTCLVQGSSCNFSR